MLSRAIMVSMKRPPVSVRFQFYRQCWYRCTACKTGTITGHTAPAPALPTEIENTTRYFKTWNINNILMLGVIDPHLINDLKY